jgi:hypothetical protein
LPERFSHEARKLCTGRRAGKKLTKSEPYRIASLRKKMAVSGSFSTSDHHLSPF